MVGPFDSAIGVLQAPDNHTPIGMASGNGRTANGLAVWRLRGMVADDKADRWVAGAESVSVYCAVALV